MGLASRIFKIHLLLKNIKMKKYITVAALLAAGTAFANAEPITQNITFDGSSSTIALDTAIDLTKNWSVTFDAAVFDPTFESDTDLFVYMLSSGGGEWNVGPYLNSDGYTGYTQLTVNDAPHYTEAEWGGMPMMFGGSFSLSYVAENKKLSLTSSYSAYGTTNSYFEELVVNDIEFSEGSTMSTLVTGVTSEMVNGGSWSFPSVSVVGVAATAPVPEPSAFGLLAGIGALALVASRRRRK